MSDTILDSDVKTFSTIAARLALRGFQCWRSDPDDGVQRFFVARWNHVRVCADLAELERFAERAGATAG